MLLNLLMRVRTYCLMTILLTLVSSADAIRLKHTEMDYQVCFTPRENCTALIVESLHSAEKSIYVQAYSFTSTAIMRALVDAARRGVDVKVLLDKTQFDNKFYTSGRFFQNNHIPVWVDDKPAIAHNKVIIIDDSTVITGSFNFTKAAQYKNAENLLIIKNNEIAAKYTANWKDRWEQSSQMSSKARHKKDDSEFIKGYKKIMSVIERQF